MRSVPRATFPVLLLPLLAAAAVAGPLGSSREQAVSEGVLRRFAPGNPVDLAWWEPVGSGVARRERRLLVLDGAAATVSAYTPRGELVMRFGSVGPGRSQMVDPSALATAADGRIYVADTGNDRVQVFDGEGALVQVLGRTGDGDGELNDPRGVAVADMGVGRDLVVVSDAGNDRLSLFTRDGRPAGHAPIARPRSLAARSGWGVLVLRAGASTLYNVYDLDRVTAYAPLARSWPAARIGRPVDLASWDGLYVADAEARQVLIFDRDHRLRRRIVGFEAPPRGVLPGRRPEMQSVLVADGTAVVEVGVVVDSPLPVFEAYRKRLEAGDVEGALGFIHPSSRHTFREIFEAVGEHLPEHAADMERTRVESLRQDRATILILAPSEGDGAREAYPVMMVRGLDGSWQILDY